MVIAIPTDILYETAGDNEWEQYKYSRQSHNNFVPSGKRSERCIRSGDARLLCSALFSSEGRLDQTKPSGTVYPVLCSAEPGRIATDDRGKCMADVRAQFQTLAFEARLSFSRQYSRSERGIRTLNAHR